MVSVTDFRKVVFDYLSLATDRKEFTLRFAALLSGIEKHGDPDAIRLGNALYSDLALAIVGAIPESELRSRLAQQFLNVEIEPSYRVDKPSSVIKENPPSDYKPAEMAFA
jgi:hypothetical protein